MYQEEIDWSEMPDNIVDGFRKFDSENPLVYVRLEKLTRKLINRGHKKIGMQMLFEVIRWQHMMRTTGEPFKLNNNYCAFYSRLIEKRNPQWGEIFTKRKSAADGEV